MIEEVKNEVIKILGVDNSGHGIKHINRVVILTEEFAEQENVNKEIAVLIALLHDVDDYKLFGIKNANNLKNTNDILNKLNIDEKTKETIINGVKTIGYSKRLKGVIPESLEAKIVSDADMCDGMGVTGILRSFKYNLSHNNSFFDREYYPDVLMSAEEYINKKEGTVVNHMFEKILKLKDLMLTKSGYEEALKRHNFMISFLREYFREEQADEWNKYLDSYLKEYVK